jgi:1,4-alpha-glucan branching enzyme
MNRVVPVTFRFPAHLAPEAARVSLVGSFNAWGSTAHPLQRLDDQTWAITVYLSPGRVVYMFCVDSAMWLDPMDEGRIPNGWGSEYSIRHVTSDTLMNADERRGGRYPGQSMRAPDAGRREDMRAGRRMIATGSR